MRAQSKRTGKRGTISFRLRAKKRGKVSISVSRAGYATKSVLRRVR